jgi:hypothetical protein
MQRENPAVVGLRPTARGVSDATLFTAGVNRVSPVAQPQDLGHSGSDIR